MLKTTLLLLYIIRDCNVIFKNLYTVIQPKCVLNMHININTGSVKYKNKEL